MKRKKRDVKIERREIELGRKSFNDKKRVFLISLFMCNLFNTALLQTFTV